MSRRRIFPLALALLLPLASPDAAAAQGGPGALHEITLSVDTNTGVVMVRPDTVYATRGDRIRFTGVGVDNWSVTFVGASPFSNRIIQGPQARTVPILPQAAYQGYKYDVSVTVGSDTWVVDPDIIVRPPAEGVRRE